MTAACAKTGDTAKNGQADTAGKTGDEKDKKMPDYQEQMKLAAAKTGGRHSLRQPRCILGTMTMGWKGFASSNVDDQAAKKMIEAYIGHQVGLAAGDGLEKANVTVELDTAILYGNGNTEKLLGRVIGQVGQVKKSIAEGKSLLQSGDDADGGVPKVKLAIKVNPFNSPKGSELSAESIRWQVSKTLQALKPCLDKGLVEFNVLYLHGPDTRYTLAQSLEECQKIMSGQITDEGFADDKVKAAFANCELGMSNYSSWEVVDAIRLCEAHSWSKARPRVYQGMYNCLTRQVELELFPVLRKFGIRFYAYNPLAGGILTGKHKRDEDVSKASKEPAGRFQNNKNYVDRYWKNSVFDSVDKLKTLLEAEQEVSDSELKGITLAQSSLLWLMNHSQLNGDKGDGILVGASTLAHLESNLEAFGAFQRSAADGLEKKLLLPQEMLDVMDQAWRTTPVGEVPCYFRGWHKLE